MFVMVARSGTESVFDAVAAVFDDRAHVALCRQELKDREDDVLCRYPGLELAREVDLDDLRTGKIERPAAHGNGDIEPARADGQHADAAARGRVGVGAQKRLSRPAEALKMDLVADAVPGLGIMDAVLCRHGLQIPVIIGVLEAVLQRVVVNVAYRKLGLHPGHAHGLELEIGHGAGGVLGQGLVDPDGDLGARLELPFDEMRLEDLVDDVLAHATRSFMKIVSRHYISK